MQLVAIAMSCSTELEQRGFKLTPQRRAVVDAIHDTEVHLTAEEITDHVQARVPGVNRSTVYRTLELLESLGTVFRTEIGGKSVYHHAHDPHHHHHLVCRRCGRIVDCDESLFLALQQELEQRYGFRAECRHMVLSGVCRACADEAGPATTDC